MRKLLRSIARSWAMDHGMKFRNVRRWWRQAAAESIRNGGKANARKARNLGRKQRRTVA